MNDFHGLLAEFRRYLVSFDDDGLSRFIDGFDWEMPARALAAHRLPVLTHLSACAPAGRAAEASLFQALTADAPSLHWGQTYGAGDFGSAFLERYGWVELFGTRGHFASDEIAGGFLMLGPEIHYPDHHHLAEEIYIPLTGGSLWSKDGGAFVARSAGEIIHHPSDIRHAMRTEEASLLALYLWRGGPLAQRPIIDGNDGATS